MALKEGLQGQNIKFNPIKNGISLSIPHLGKMRVYIFNQNSNANLYYRINKVLKEDLIIPLYKGKKRTPSTFLHSNGDVYFYSKENNATKQLATSNALIKFSVYDNDYVIASVKSAIDYYKERSPKKVWALNNNE